MINAAVQWAAFVLIFGCGELFVLLAVLYFVQLVSEAWHDGARRL